MRASHGAHRLAAVAILLVLIEVVVLAINRWRCPLTDLAACYTDQRQANFDIYLPLWLARYNKWVYGLRFGLGSTYALWRGLGTL